MYKIILLAFLVVCFSFADKSYINIISNAKPTQIFIDNKSIGYTPIKLYQVVSNKPILLRAVANKDYYKKDIITKIKVQDNTIKTIKLKFTKAKAKIFFAGDDANLYIDNKFIKKLNGTNRLVTVDASPKLDIFLKNKFKDKNITINIKANEQKTIKYNLRLTPEDIRLYTTTIDKLMWEDTKHITSSQSNWEDANFYCNKLSIGSFTNWRLPKIKELKSLNKTKDKLYNKLGKQFYWSNTTFDDDKHIWSYSYVFDFTKEKQTKSVQNFDKGLTICVRDLNTTKSINNINKDSNTTDINATDNNITKDTNNTKPTNKKEQKTK